MKQSKHKIHKKNGGEGKQKYIYSYQQGYNLFVSELRSDWGHRPGISIG